MEHWKLVAVLTLVLAGAARTHTSVEVVRPHVFAENILDINFRKLYESGFRHILLDDYNTLSGDVYNQFDNIQFQNTVEKMQNIFGNREVAILSNDDRLKKFMRLDNNRFGLNIIPPQRLKPYATNNIVNYF